MEHKKDCRNCLYFIKPSISESIEAGYEFAKCRAPNIGSGLDYVVMAANQRKYKGNEFCGPEGKWYKTKDDFYR